MLPHDISVMRSLFFKRLFRAVMGLMMLVVLSFFIIRSISGDPLRKMCLGGDQLYAAESTARIKNHERLYRKMGFNLPLFYVTISGMAVPDSFKRLPDQRFKDLLIKTAYWSGNPEAAYEWCSWYRIHFDRKFDFVHPEEFSSQLDRAFSLSDLNAFDKDSVVSKSSLKQKGLIKIESWPVKILGNGALEKRLTVKVDKVTAGARKAIEQLGGKLEEA